MQSLLAKWYHGFPDSKSPLGDVHDTTVVVLVSLFLDAWDMSKRQ